MHPITVHLLNVVLEIKALFMFQYFMVEASPVAQR